jgi:hypothetical protein
MGDLLPVLIPVGILSVLGWIIRSVVHSRRQQKVAQLQAEMQTRLIEKFGTPQELLAYLDSPAGQRFLESATIERGNPYGRILGALQAGVILVLAGAAFLATRRLMGSDGEVGFIFLGTLAVALGAGFLISATLAYKLSRAWGLVRPAERPAE